MKRKKPSRRSFLDLTVRSLGGAAAASLLTGTQKTYAASAAAAPHVPGPHFPGKAKHVIYLHMVGGPSQMDLYDYKPKMDAMYDKDLPDSIRNGQRLTGMTSGQARFPVAPSMYKFKQYGKCGMWVSELLPNTAKIVDEMCFIRSMNTDAINHEPAITFAQTGNQVAGRPCLGSWVSYALGALNQNLPAFVVMVAQSTNREQLQAISAKLWTSGYLPGEHAGVSFRTTGDPILYINNPPGVPADIRRVTLDGIRSLNELEFHELNDPDTVTRTKQYELALRMQDSVPELVDLAKEPKTTWELYGEDAKKPGTFANSALQARRMVERGVRFVQIYHNNWDEHSNMAGRLPSQCKDVDRACYGLITDLKQRGMLKDTLVIWGGEFGRTIYSQGGLSHTNYGRDHHPRCYTMWMCGGGAKAGEIYGETDDFSYNIVKDPVKVHDFHATILHLLGFDHERLTFKYQGLDQKLTGVEPSKVVKDLLA
jgi:hypothetical protein